MDEKYMVQFITLLGSAFASIMLAIGVCFERITIVRALVILIAVIIVFYVMGRIIHKVYLRIHNDVLQRERDEKARIQEEEQAKKKAAEQEAADKEKTDAV